IVMTSFAFILGVVPLVLASGAGASARASIGITVFTGMLATTCLAVLFVPPFFAVVQRFEEWRKASKIPAPASKPAAEPPSQDIPSGQELWILLTARSHNLDAGIRILSAGLQHRKSHDPLHVPCDVGLCARPDGSDRGILSRVRSSGPGERASVWIVRPFQRKRAPGRRSRLAAGRSGPHGANVGARSRAAS